MDFQDLCDAVFLNDVLLTMYVCTPELHFFLCVNFYLFLVKINGISSATTVKKSPDS